MSAWRFAKQDAIIKQPCKKLMWCTLTVNTDMKQFTEAVQPDMYKFGVYHRTSVQQWLN